MTLKRAIVAAVAALTIPAATLVAAQPAQATTTLFADEFAGAAGPALSSLSPDASGASRSGSKWTEWSSATYNGSAAYGSITTGAADRARLDGAGHLIIKATPTQGTSISTKDLTRFAYGTFEARIKVQGNSTGPGYWPAFWLLNASPKGDPVNSTGTIGEIDALEAYTGLDDYGHVAVHNYDVAHNGAGSWSGADDPKIGEGTLFDTWHTFGAIVAPGKTTFTYDGVVTNTVYASEQPDKPYALYPDNTAGLWPILTLAVGGAGGQQDPGTTHGAVGNGKMLVDWVHITR